MNNRVIMKNHLVTDRLMVVLYMVTKPYHVSRVDYYEVDVQRCIRSGIYYFDTERGEVKNQTDTWITDGVRAQFRDFERALEAYEQKQRDLAARIILGE